MDGWMDGDLFTLLAGFWAYVHLLQSILVHPLELSGSSWVSFFQTKTLCSSGEPPASVSCLFDINQSAGSVEELPPPYFRGWKTRSRCYHPLKKSKVMVKPTKKHKDPFHPFPLLSPTWMRCWQNTEQELLHLSFKETQYSQFTTGTISSSGLFPWLMKLGINVDLQFGQRRVLEGGSPAGTLPPEGCHHHTAAHKSNAALLHLYLSQPDFPVLVLQALRLLYNNCPSL